MNIKVTLTILEADSLLSVASQMEDDAREYYSFDKRIVPAYFRAVRKIVAALTVEEEKARVRLVKLCAQIAANYGEDYEE